MIKVGEFILLGIEIGQNDYVPARVNSKKILFYRPGINDLLIFTVIIKKSDLLTIFDDKMFGIRVPAYYCNIQIAAIDEKIFILF